MEITPAERAARAARFAADTTVPTVKRTFAHADFDRKKMVVSDATERFRSLLLRKLVAGEAVSAAQLGAASAHGIDIDALRAEAMTAPVVAPALYVEAGLVPKPKRKVSKGRPALHSDAGTSAASATRKSRRTSLGTAPLVVSTATGTTEAAGCPVAPPALSGMRTRRSLTAVAAPPPEPAAEAASEPGTLEVPGGPKPSTTPRQARAALTRIARLEAARAAGEPLTAGQIARITARPLWQAIADAA